jgi:hypothetical protein
VPFTGILQARKKSLLPYLIILLKVWMNAIPMQLKVNNHPKKNLQRLFQNQFSFFKKHPHFVVAVFSDGLMEESQRINETILKIMAVKMKHLMPIILEGTTKESIY